MRPSLSGGPDSTNLWGVSGGHVSHVSRSRGMGDLKTKLAAAGAPRVIITYNVMRKRAEAGERCRL
jgi:hypothetical protein